MAVAWFVAPYARRDARGRPGRYCSMDDHTSAIRADGGAWAEAEILGGRAVVKVRAAEGTLDTVAATEDVVRLPDVGLDDPIPAADQDALLDLLLDLGYTASQIEAKIGDPALWTLRDWLTMAASRRYEPRYDQATDRIVCDGKLAQCRPIVDVDAAVQEG